MTEQEKSSNQVIKSSQMTEIDGKDKDKMNSNEIKMLFNITNNNKLDDYIKESRNTNQVNNFKKIQKKTFLRNNTNSNNNLNHSEKDPSLLKENSHEDLLTIINTTKKNLSKSFSNKKSKVDKKPIKNPKKKVDMFYFHKYQNIKPQKDYSFKNSSSTIFSKEEKTKSKNTSMKSFESKFHSKEVKPLPKLDKRNKRQILDPKLQKLFLSKSNNSMITTYLDRKKINDLPVLYPLFLSYNNSYDNQSEKCRVNKILEKFVQLKTQIVKDYKNREKIIREFLMKNGITDKKYFTSEKFASLNEYLKKPFKFDPKKRTVDIIKEALNYKYDLIETDRNELLPVNIFNNYNITHRNGFFHPYKSKSMNDLKIKEKKIYQNPICLKFEEMKFDNAHLPKLVMELEENLEKIQNEGDEKINKLRGGIGRLKKFMIKDKNKYVPNLCMKNEDFKGQYDFLIKRANTKLLNNYNRMQHIREINDRMYYNNLKKKYHDQGVNDEIKRKLKLTEYIIVQRAKKKMFLEQFNNFNIKRSNSLIDKK
jgi:hypothetical protein